MDRDTTFIGLDVSKETIAVALAEGGRRDEERFYGTISSKPETVAKPVMTLAAKHGTLAFAYEAGPNRLRLVSAAHATRLCLPRSGTIDDASASR